MLGLGLSMPYMRSNFSIGGFDPDYRDILAQGTPPSESIQTAQNNLIVEIKTVGDLWIKIRSLYIWRDGTVLNGAFKTIDWKRLGNATLVSAPTIATTGIQGNGTNYVNLNFNANDAVNNPSLDGDLTVGYWSVNGTNGTTAQVAGVDSSGDGIQILTQLSNSQRIFTAVNSINNIISNTGLALNGDTELITATNNGTITELRRNSTVLGSFTPTSLIANADIYALARNRVGSTAGLFSDDTLSMTIISEALTLAEISGLKTAFDNYILAL
jgi:hypothetical protein